MPDEQVYLSIVVAARNDDHGGNFKARMQAFLNALIAQCSRHALDAELIVVEWNPPPGRPPLAQAFEWPADTAPLRIRFIEVPPEIHARYRHAEALPLYQMIAKNVGIRRARGEFILATNIDIIFSEELMRFLAERRLEKGKMYRVDRYDAASGVPVDGSIEDRLAYCESHSIRVNTRDGTFGLTGDGLRALAEHDVAEPESGIRFGNGFRPAEGAPGPVFRWAGGDAEIVVSPSNPAGRELMLDLEPGPALSGQAFFLEVTDSAEGTVQRFPVGGRRWICVPVRTSASASKTLRLRVAGSPASTQTGCPRLDFRLFRCGWRDSIPALSQGKVSESLFWSSGWYDLETFGGVTFRWAKKLASLILLCQRVPSRLHLKLEPGPEVGCQPCTLHVTGGDGSAVISAPLVGATEVQIPVGGSAGEVCILRFAIEGGGEPIETPEDSRTLAFRVLSCRWKALNLDFDENVLATACSLAPGERRFTSIWSESDKIEESGDSRFEASPVRLIARAPLEQLSWAEIEIEIETSVSGDPLLMELTTADGNNLLLASVTGRHRYTVERRLNPGEVLVLQLRAGPGGGAGEGIARLKWVNWTWGGIVPPNHETIALENGILPVHSNACGDFTLLAKADWLDLRGYAEVNSYSMHIDSLFCLAARFAGFPEEVLSEPMRIYHIEHGTGSGWTPEGEKALYARLEVKGIPWIQYDELVQQGRFMNRFGMPAIFNGKDWGLAGCSLREITIGSIRGTAERPGHEKQPVEDGT